MKKVLSIQSKDRQRGFFVLTVSLILGAIMIMVLSFSSFAIRKATISADETLRKQVDEAMIDVEFWYQRNADAIAARGFGASEDEIKNGLSKPYPNLRFSMSDSMATTACLGATDILSCIPWRRIAIWVPKDLAGGSITYTKGLPTSMLTADNVWRVYSSQEWFYDRVTKTNHQVTHIGRALMSWFNVQKSLDPRKIHSTNFYRVKDCNLVDAPLPCYDDYTPLSQTKLPQILGLHSSELNAQLDKPIEFSNLKDSVLEYPFAASLRVVTPWGQVIRQTVTQ